MNPFSYRLISITSVVVGLISLVAFFFFVLLGPFKIVELNTANTHTLLLNSLLSILFFAQHSIIIRQPVKEKITSMLPSECFYAFHSIISGTILLGVVILWQKSPVVITLINKPYSYLLFSLQFLAIIGLMWGVKSLKDFDPFGRKQISKHLKKKKYKGVSLFIEDHIILSGILFTFSYLL